MWILMAWCFSTRASVATVLITHQCVSRCLRDKRWHYISFALKQPILAIMMTMLTSLIERFLGPTWGPSGADRTQVGPMLAPWTLLCGYNAISHHMLNHILNLVLISCPDYTWFCLILKSFLRQSPKSFLSFELDFVFTNLYWNK